MILIAENKHVMSAAVGAALKSREKAPVQDLARRAVTARPVRSSGA